MSAFIWVDPMGRILGSGVSDRPPVPIPILAHCAYLEIEDSTKLAIEGEGHDRFFVAADDESSDEIMLERTADGRRIYYKTEIALRVNKQIFTSGVDAKGKLVDTVTVTHDGRVPIKLWSGMRPIRGKHAGKVHPDEGHTLGSRAPGHYTIKVRDPRHWAEPIEVRARVAGEQEHSAHGLE